MDQAMGKGQEKKMVQRKVQTGTSPLHPSAIKYSAKAELVAGRKKNIVRESNSHNQICAS